MATEEASRASDPDDAQAYVRSLRRVGPSDRTIVGGKAAQLGGLLQAGVLVPPGFCVTTTAFAEVTNDESFRERLAALDAAEASDLAARAAAIRQYLRTRPIPEAIRSAIEQAWATVGRAHRYAVRSSAAAEDGHTTSFAGQLETRLNVIGLDAIFDSIIVGWCSWFSDAAVTYRRAHGLSHATGVAVLVQRMVMADRSGVLFTAHPLSGHRYTAGINAIYGLGEAFVSGRAAADWYEFDKRKQVVTATNVATKDRATRARREGGLYQVDVSPNRRQARVLTDAEVIDLGRLGTQIEAQQGSPQDIEWCYEGKKLFVVQTRPITTLYPLPSPPPDDEHEHVYLCVNHFQVMTDAMPPLSCSAWAYALPFAKSRRRAGPSPWVVTAGGRVYLDISTPLRSSLLRAPMLRALENVDALASRALDVVAARPSFARGPRVHGWSVLPVALPLVARLAAALLWRNPERLAASTHVIVDEQIERLESTIDTHPGRYLAKIRDHLATLIFRLLTIMPRVLAGALAARVLRKLVHASNEDFAALGRGLTGNLTTQMDLDLGDVADVAHHDPTLRAAFAAIDGDADSLLAHVARTTNVAFAGAWHRFLARYGSRAASEIDPSRPRWREDSRILLRSIAGSLRQASPGLHRRQHAEFVEKADHVTAHMIAQARRTRWGWLRARIVARLIRVHRQLVPLREHPKFVLVHAFDHLRRATLAVGEAMAARGQIDATNEVWFLELDELLDAFHHPQRKVRARIERRRQAFAHEQKLFPPRVMTSEGESPQVGHAHGEPHPYRLFGTPVSHGDVVGRARVMHDPTTETLQPGEILVAPFTDPGWTPLFLNAKALVMEVGGVMTHGSVIAREVGIPAVVCVPEATTRICTGQRLRVDGTAGVVEIMDEGVVAP